MIASTWYLVEPARLHWSLRSEQPKEDVAPAPSIWNRWAL
jgi:hypothetical protein